MTKTPQHNVPELRFPEFEGEWEARTLGEVSHKLSYGLNAAAKDFDGKNAYIRITDINENSRQINIDKLTSPSKYSDEYIVEKNDILFARTGASTGKTYIHKLINNLNFYYAGFLIKAKINNDCCSDFIFQNTLTSKYNHWVDVMSVRSGQPGINSKEYSKFNIYFPSLIEQQKIGSFFSKLDRQIELEEKKLELLEQQKKGYMQKIFSQELRFKDENGSDYPKWEGKTIESVTQYTSSKKSANQYTESKNCEGYPVYDAIREIGKELQYDMKEPYISILKDGAGVGRLNLREGQSSVIGTMGYLQAVNVNIHFLYYRINMLNFKKYIIGSTIPHLYYKDYSKEKIQVPSNSEEQMKIGQFILKIDKLIDNKVFKLDQLKQRKQALLQKMFV